MTGDKLALINLGILNDDKSLVLQELLIAPISTTIINEKDGEIEYFIALFRN